MIGGLALARVLDASGLMLVFGVIALVVGLYQFFASPDLTIRSTLPGARCRRLRACSSAAPRRSWALAVA